MKPVILLWLPILLTACGGGSHLGGESSAPLATAAASTPPQARDTLDRSSTLTGADTNNDGIRDDINKWIEAQGLTAPQQKAVAQLARAFQEVLLVDANDRAAARAAAEKDGNAIDCVFLAFKPDAEQAGRIASQIEAITANTKERASRYIKFNTALGGMAFTMPDEPTCD